MVFYFNLIFNGKNYSEVILEDATASKGKYFSSVDKDVDWRKTNAIKNKKFYKILSLPFNVVDRPPSATRVLGAQWFGNLFKVGPNYKVLLPTSLLIGGIFMLVVDDIARSVFVTEIPLGILTSIIGAPFFLYLLLKGKKGWV